MDALGGDDLVILPKDRVVQVEVNRRIEAPVNTVLPSQVVHRFIDVTGVHFVMDFRICRESTKCMDYLRDLTLPDISDLGTVKRVGDAVNIN